uniref:Lipase 1 n=2 Tax=Cacopsylla melanoneura TaxID=428564 RepID=A0A8D8ZV49_9HEMI
MSLILLSLVMFLLEFVSSAQYPLINKNNYMYLAPEGNSNKVDISNPWRFNFIDTTGLIKHWGYEGEEHSVTTEDGYIISIYHIVPKQNNSPPVLIMHGLLANSESFLARGEKDLPILLTEAGYDVWVGNFRGNNNGKRHVNMTSDNEDFWKFSFHELGIYDLPAFVDYILDRSSFSKMTIIAHSLANAATLVMTSTKPEYNDKINLFVGLAPYVFAVNFPPGPLAEPLLRSAVVSIAFESFDF